jgi:hypothetical protein
MNKSDLIAEITATYKKHGWELKRALLKSETAGEISEVSFGGVTRQESTIDALWFSRPSHGGAEGWELRLVAETPYALFERIESEDQDKREEILSDVQKRMTEYASGS